MLYHTERCRARLHQASHNITPLGLALQCPALARRARPRLINPLRFGSEMIYTTPQPTPHNHCLLHNTLPRLAPLRNALPNQFPLLIGAGSHRVECLAFRGPRSEYKAIGEPHNRFSSVFGLSLGLSCGSCSHHDTGHPPQARCWEL